MRRLTVVSLPLKLVFPGDILLPMLKKFAFAGRKYFFSKMQDIGTIITIRKFLGKFLYYIILTNSVQLGKL
jgi:hypothetical protein